jgi:hypothetical protein
VVLLAGVPGFGPGISGSEPLALPLGYTPITLIILTIIKLSFKPLPQFGYSDKIKMGF